MTDCLFCRMVAGEIPADVVLQTDRVFAFRDINPQAPTHVLVIPKDHHATSPTLAAADAGPARRGRRRARTTVARQEGLVSDGGSSRATAWSPTPGRRPASRCTTCTSTSSAGAGWSGRPAETRRRRPPDVQRGRRRGGCSVAEPGPRDQAEAGDGQRELDQHEGDGRARGCPRPGRTAGAPFRRPPRRGSTSPGRRPGRGRRRPAAGRAGAAGRARSTSCSSGAPRTFSEMVTACSIGHGCGPAPCASSR